MQFLIGINQIKPFAIGLFVFGILICFLGLMLVGGKADSRTARFVRTIEGQHGTVEESAKGLIVDIRFVDLKHFDFKLLKKLEIAVLKLPPGISQDQLISIGKQPGLVELECRRCVGIRELGNLPSLAPNLEFLDLSRSGITDLGISGVENFVGLKILNLNATAIGDSSGESISKIAGIKKLLVHRTKVSDNFVKTVSTNLSIDSLYLGDNAITKQSLDSIAKMAQLRLLDISFTDIETGFSVLSSTKIERLDLRGFRHLSDKEVTAIGNLQSLRDLNIAGCKVSEDALTFIKSRCFVRREQE